MTEMEEDAVKILKNALATAKAVQNQPAEEPEIEITLDNRQASIKYKRGDITVEKDKMMSRLEREIDEEYSSSDTEDQEEYSDQRVTDLKQKEKSTGNGKTGTKEKILNS